MVPAPLLCFLLNLNLDLGPGDCLGKVDYPQNSQGLARSFLFVPKTEQINLAAISNKPARNKMQSHKPVRNSDFQRISTNET
jgi:hypothetical protein